MDADCLNEIFENLEYDKITLHSCLLVNSLWCNISVRILWREFLNYYGPHQYEIIDTLFACLPNESKELLHKNRIFISKPKSPLFNYPAFCRVLSIYGICELVDKFFRFNQSNTSLSMKDRIFLVLKEIVKMFMDHSHSLKSLIYHLEGYGLQMGVPDNIVPFTFIPGEKNCLTDLSELHCSSNIRYDFFHQLSQICHNLRSLSINFTGASSYDGLKELISLQNNLKNLNISIGTTVDRNGLPGIIPALTKHSDTLIKLHLNNDRKNYLPLSFISSFYNLREIVLYNYGDCEELQYVALPKLKALKFAYRCPNTKHVMKFLEINGINLEEVYMDKSNNALRSSIARFCPNLKKLFVAFSDDEIGILREIFNSCQYLESIKIWCGEEYLNEKEVLEIVATHSPKNFYELKIYYRSKFFPEDLESFLVSWKNRTPNKSLSLINIKWNHGFLCEDHIDHMKIIEKYKNLGVIKKFETKVSEKNMMKTLFFKYCFIAVY